MYNCIEDLFMEIQLYCFQFLCFKLTQSKLGKGTVRRLAKNNQWFDQPFLSRHEFSENCFNLIELDSLSENG